jgi:hypothetical protein
VKRFCIPPERSAPFVYAMEDVLDVYERRYDPAFPVVCFDESSKQLVEHTRLPLPPAPGAPRRVDDEYKRCGTANIFIAVEPLAGNVVVQATEHRASVDCAKFLKHLIDDEYPDAERLVLVMDNLSTHTPACFYEAFEPAEARRLTQKLEIHYTPKHGSWLNIAEMQISIIARQCLDQRIGSLREPRRKLRMWEAARTETPVSWQFTAENARIKLRRLYPSFQ